VDGPIRLGDSGTAHPVLTSSGPAPQLQVSCDNRCDRHSDPTGISRVIPGATIGGINAAILAADTDFAFWYSFGQGFRW
jgi:hypothetical protein